jgi:hypothetical protein
VYAGILFYFFLPGFGQNASNKYANKAGLQTGRQPLCVILFKNIIDMGVLIINC